MSESVSTSEVIALSSNEDAIALTLLTQARSGSDTFWTTFAIAFPVKIKIKQTNIAIKKLVITNFFIAGVKSIARFISKLWLFGRAIVAEFFTAKRSDNCSILLEDINILSSVIEIEILVSSRFSKASIR
jgi:hypothetical protein